MPKKSRTDVVLVWDCGSTKLAVAAVDAKGSLVASANAPNAPVKQPGGKKAWLIHDLDNLFARLAQCTRQVVAEVGAERIRAVTVTTWGADGTCLAADGAPTYPPIAWACSRTQPYTESILERISAWELFRTSGYQIIHFNTLFRLLWMRDHAPKALDKAKTWMMMPGLFSWKLCGEMSLDPTAASTMMAMNLGKRAFSSKLLSLAGVGTDFFPPLTEPGQVIGEVTRTAARRTGLPAGISVVAGGHDTQFAPYGSGAEPGEAILSTGTWEIPMLQVNRYRPNRTGFRDGLIIEADARPGWWNPQLLMTGSAVLEWIRDKFFSDLRRDASAYRMMIAQARRVEPGCGGVMLIPSFQAGTGPAKQFGTLGTLTGLTVTSSRAQVYRAGLEGLCFQLRSALSALEAGTGFAAKGIRAIGGGSRNALWNQLRADVTGLPVTTTSHKEATVLGAALFARVGAGLADSVAQAAARIRFGEKTFTPRKALADTYTGLFEKYQKLPTALNDFYGAT